MSIKVGVVSLGCDKNRVDTEVMLANLVKGGYEIVSDPQLADVIIVNTCAFLESARREAIQSALEMASYKTVGKCKKVIITGCLGQKFGEDVFKLRRRNYLRFANLNDGSARCVLKDCRRMR